MHSKMTGKWKQAKLQVLACITIVLVSLLTPNAMAGSGCCDVPGDADNNTIVNLADAVFMAQYMFGNAAAPTCPQKWDADGSGRINIRDVMRIIRFAVVGGTAPVCPATEISYEERSIVFNALDSIATALGNVPPDSLATILFTYLNGRSEFSYVDREDNSLWATFTDGRMLLIPNNRFPDNSGTHEKSDDYQPPDSIIPEGFVVPKPIRRSSEKNQNTATSSQAPTYEVPESLEAFVITTLGSPCFTTMTGKVKTLLSNAGYTINSLNGTVPDFLTKVKDAGVFFIDAHGGWGETTSGGTVLGALWTNSLRSSAGDSTYKSLLDNNELVYMFANDADSLGVCKNQKRYAITGKFVQNYMTFKKNGFVLINACELAASSRGGLLAEGFKTAGASVYAGWTLTVTDPPANKAGEFLIDRMLGANASTLTPVESPKQRPFDITQLKQEMQTHNPRYDVDPSNGSELIITKLKDGFELLAPSLRFVEVINYTDTLFLTGYFGSDPGSKGHVYVNGEEQTIYTWQPQYIWASIPKSGPGSSGPITVERDGDASLTPLVHRKSNPVNLTDWYGTFTYTEQNAGLLKGTINIHAHLRADVHAFREAPHTTPAPNQFIVFGGVKDSDGDAKAEGTFLYPVPDSDPHEDLTWTWDGDSTGLGWVNDPDPQGILLQGTIKANIPRMELLVFGSAFFVNAQEITSSLNGSQGISDLLFSPPYELYDAPFPSTYTLYIDMHPTTWNLLAGSRTLTKCCSVNPDNPGTDLDLTHKIEWNTIPASFGPDATAAQ